MSLPNIGLWVVVIAAVPAVVVIVVSLIALWGSSPEERPEILRALAELVRATRRR